MTQDAIVLKNFENGIAEVAVMRGTACGGSCGSCESCIYQSEVHLPAINHVNALPGEKVTIESKTSFVYRAALLVYILPIVFLIAGYCIAAAAGASEGACIGAGFGALALGLLGVVISQRNKKPITYHIVSIDEPEGT